MKTITIPDPMAVRAEILAEIRVRDLKCDDVFVYLAATRSAAAPKWQVVGWVGANSSTGESDDIEAARAQMMDGLRKAADPLAKLKREAESHGMKLVPA